MAAGTIAILTVCGGILAALIGGWVELVKARRAQAAVHHEVTPNSGGSLRDAVDRIERAVDKVRDAQVAQGERVARVEAKIENWATPNRRASDPR
jgi:hypothetical protein